MSSTRSLTYLQSTVSSVRNSDGVVRVDHKVKSLKRVPCHR